MNTETLEIAVIPLDLNDSGAATRYSFLKAFPANGNSKSPF